MPLAVQAVAMGFDEFYFHRRRGLGRWERLGHPFDTMTVVACMAWVLFTKPTRSGLAAYAVLAVFSCLFVTKDEWIHARSCSPGEHWLHAILFLVHPVSLTCVGLLWPALRLEEPPLSLFRQPVGPWSERLLAGQFVMTGGFCVYQVIYWNVRWPRIPLARSITRSTTPSTSAGIARMTIPSPCSEPSPCAERHL